MLKPEEIIEMRKRWDECAQQVWESNPENKREQEARQAWREQQRAQGKIFNHNIKNWLDGEIIAARVALALGMILTVLIKGQIVIWVIMYIAYRLRIKRAKEEALEADRRSDYK